jgi:hypothetical protein
MHKHLHCNLETIVTLLWWPNLSGLMSSTFLFYILLIPPPHHISYYGFLSHHNLILILITILICYVPTTGYTLDILLSNVLTAEDISDIPSILAKISLLAR